MNKFVLFRDCFQNSFSAVELRNYVILLHSFDTFLFHGFMISGTFGRNKQSSWSQVIHNRKYLMALMFLIAFASHSYFLFQFGEAYFYHG